MLNVARAADQVAEINQKSLTLEELILNTATKVIIPVLATLAVGAIIYAGTLYLMSQGDSEKLSKAKRALVWPIVGVVLIVLSFTLVLALRQVVYKQI